MTGYWIDISPYTTIRQITPVEPWMEAVKAEKMAANRAQKASRKGAENRASRPVKTKRKTVKMMRA